MLKQLMTGAFIFMVSMTSCAHAQTVGVEEFESGLNDKQVQLLDVRTPEEFEEGHLANAMLAPVNDEKEFDRRIAALDKSKPVYVYCLSGGRSRSAAAQMRKEGFEKVVELKGGINAWKKADKPLEGVADIPQTTMEEYQDMVQQHPLVLVDFGAPWCPPCRKMEPVIKELEKEYNGRLSVIKVDGGTQTSLMKGNDIEAMPGFILYKNGKEVWRGSGVIKKEEMSQQISRNTQ